MQLHNFHQDAGDHVFSALFPANRVDDMRKVAKEMQLAHARGEISQYKTRYDGQGWVRADASESFFLAGQLEFIRTGLIEMRYPDLKIKTIVPTNVSIPAGAQDYTYQEVDEVGDAMVGADKADDAMMVDVFASETTSRIKSIRNGYQYSDEEILAAMYSGMPLQTRKATAARNIMERRLDAIGWLGSSAYTGAPPNLKGLANLANTVTYTVPAGQFGTTAPEQMTPKEILYRLNALVAAVVTGSNDIHHPTDIVLPLSFMNLLTTTTMGDGNNQTILTTFVANQPWCKSVTFSHKLDANASAPWTTGRRVIAFERNPDLIELLEPMGFTQKPVQLHGYQYKTFCWAKTGGVVAYKPKSVVYADFAAIPA